MVKSILILMLLLCYPLAVLAYTYDNCVVNGTQPIEVWSQAVTYCTTEAACVGSIETNPNYCPVFENPGCAHGTYWVRHAQDPYSYEWTVDIVDMQPGTPHTPVTRCLGHEMYDPYYTYRCNYWCGFIQPLVSISSPGSTVKAGKQVAVIAHAQDELQMLSLSIMVMNNVGTVIMQCSTSGQADLICPWNIPTGRGKTYTIQASGTNAGGVSDSVTQTVTTN